MSRIAGKKSKINTFNNGNIGSGGSENFKNPKKYSLAKFLVNFDKVIFF